MQEQYHSSAVEKEAQKIWQEQDVYRVVEGAKNAAGEEKPKYYACSMLPYPSG